MNKKKHSKKFALKVEENVQSRKKTEMEQYNHVKRFENVRRVINRSQLE